MQIFHIKESKLKGKIVIPSSKSHSLRAIFFAMLAEGTSTIRDYLPSPDTDAMISAISQFGAKVVRSTNTLQIHGVGKELQPVENIIDAGNSGLVLRFIGAIA